MTTSKKRSAILSDLWTTTDALSFDDYLNALNNILETAATPLTVGVFGPWGSGKTSLLRMLEKNIRDKGLASCRAVWFTAWKYDRSEALWRAFILRVIDGLYPKEKGARIPLEKLPDKDQQEGVQYLDRLAKSLYQDVAWQEKGGWSLDLGELGAQAAKLPAWLVFHLAGQGELATLFNINVDVAKALEREVQSFQMTQLASMEQFENEFETAVDLILGEDGRLVVFVDDLDRCLPEKAIEVLEAIKLFLNVRKTVFVLGMDCEVIRRGIESHYGIYFQKEAQERGELPINGDVYLQKLIQLPFNLPPMDVDSTEEFICELEKDAPAESCLDAVTRKAFAIGVLPNPRQIKRALNVFTLLKTIAANQEESQEPKPEPLSLPLLAKTVLIQSQWPEFYTLWRQYPTLVITLEQEFARLMPTEEEIFLGPRRAKPQPQVVELGTADPKDEPTITGGLLDPFLKEARKYTRLALLLAYPEKVEPGQPHAKFTGLSLGQLRRYLGLAGAVEAQAEDVQTAVPGDLLEELLSGDVGKIREAAARLQEQDKEGGLVSGMQERLAGALQDPAQPTRTRVSAGNGLAEIGDPRFDPEAFYLPKDEMLGFVEVPAGSFLMGTSEEDAQTLLREGVSKEWVEDQQPQHEIALPAFYIAKYPVTVAQYREFIVRSGYKGKGAESFEGLINHPIVNVTWHDAMAYCLWLDETLKAWHRMPERLSRLFQQGWQMTLPSEVQWEKAARGGDGRVYSWGNTFDADKANVRETGVGGTSAVGAFPAGVSPFGAFDMLGNVWEWTTTLYGERDIKRNEYKSVYRYPYTPDDGRERLDAPDEFTRGLRGSSFGPELARCATRRRRGPDHWSNSLGFRVVVSPPRKP